MKLIYKGDPFVEGWNNKYDMMSDFQMDPHELVGAKILYASYSTGDYCGNCDVVFRRNRKLYHVEGSHCSCFGLEGQWSPVETNELALYKTCGGIAKILWGEQK